MGGRPGQRERQGESTHTHTHTHTQTHTHTRGLRLQMGGRRGREISRSARPHTHTHTLLTHTLSVCLSVRPSLSHTHPTHARARTHTPGREREPFQRGRKQVSCAAMSCRSTTSNQNTLTCLVCMHRRTGALATRHPLQCVMLMCVACGHTDHLRKKSTKAHTRPLTHSRARRTHK